MHLSEEQTCTNCDERIASMIIMPIKQGHTSDPQPICSHCFLDHYMANSLALFGVRPLWIDAIPVDESERSCCKEMLAHVCGHADQGEKVRFSVRLVQYGPCAKSLTCALCPEGLAALLRQLAKRVNEAPAVLVIHGGSPTDFIFHSI